MTRAIVKAIFIFAGYYRVATDSSYISLADGREMTDNEFQSLADPSSPDRTSCPNCECAYMNTAGKLVWAECSETHKYVCEYKGNTWFPIRLKSGRWCFQTISVEI